MPFYLLSKVNLEQPVFGANYLTGYVTAEPNGNFTGEAEWRLTFNKGGCIDFGKALLTANELGIYKNCFNNFIQLILVSNHRLNTDPPRYAPPSGAYFSPPPTYYTTQNGLYNGFQAPINVFPDQPPRKFFF